MKDDVVQARERFLEEVKKLFERTGKPVKVMGRAAWEQRTGDKLPMETATKKNDEQEKADEAYEHTRNKTEAGLIKD